MPELFDLAIFAAAPIDTDVYRPAVSFRLARDTSPDSGQSAAACFWNVFAAFCAMDLPGTRW